MARRSGTIVGPLLIVVGLLMLLSRLGVPAFSHLWPFLILAAGAGMLIRYFQIREDSGLVFAGTLLVLIGGLFQIDQWFWLDFGDHWPFFVLAPGIGLLAMAMADRDRRDALVPAGILIVLAFIMYLLTAGFFHRLFRVVWAIVKVIVQIGVPVGLIGLGAWLLLGRRERLGVPGNDFPEKYEPGRPSDAWGGPPPHAPSPPPADPAVVEDAQIESVEEETAEIVPEAVVEPPPAESDASAEPETPEEPEAWAETETAAEPESWAEEPSAEPEPPSPETPSPEPPVEPDEAPDEPAAWRRYTSAPDDPAGSGDAEGDESGPGDADDDKPGGRE